MIISNDLELGALYCGTLGGGDAANLLAIVVDWASASIYSSLFPFVLLFFFFLL